MERCRRKNSHSCVAILLCAGALLASDPESLVTDFTGSTVPFDAAGQYVTSEFYSAPACMGVAAQQSLSKSDGWPYQASGLFYAGQDYPSFALRMRFMVKLGRYPVGSRGFSIDVIARRHPGNIQWLGAYVGRVPLVTHASSAGWFVGMDTVIADCGDLVEQGGKTLRELCDGPITLYLHIVPQEERVYVDDIHIAAESDGQGVPVRLSVLPRSAPAEAAVLRVFAPNGRVCSAADQVRAAFSSAVTVTRAGAFATVGRR